MASTVTADLAPFQAEDTQLTDGKCPWPAGTPATPPAGVGLHPNALCSQTALCVSASAHWSETETRTGAQLWAQRLLVGLTELPAVSGPREQEGIWTLHPPREQEALRRHAPGLPGLSPLDKQTGAQA